MFRLNTNSTIRKNQNQIRIRRKIPGFGQTVIMVKFCHSIAGYHFFCSSHCRWLENLKWYNERPGLLHIIVGEGREQGWARLTLCLIIKKFYLFIQRNTIQNCHLYVYGSWISPRKDNAYSDLEQK